MSGGRRPSPQAREDFIEQTRQQITSMRDEVQGAQSNDNGGFSTKKTSGMPSLGKGKGYVSAVGSDDHGMEMGGEGLSNMASAANDEILGMETPIVPQSRHKGKKVCLGLTLVVLLLAGGAAAAAAGKGGDEADGEARVRRRLLFAQPSQRSWPRDDAAPSWSSSSVVESFAP